MAELTEVLEGMRSIEPVVHFCVTECAIVKKDFADLAGS